MQNTSRPQVDSSAPQPLTGRTRRKIVRALVRAEPRSNGAGPPRLGVIVPGIGTAIALLADPTELQRAGHEALGDVFTLSLFGLPLTFVGGKDAAERFIDAGEELNLVDAYRRLAGRILGEDLFVEVQPHVLRALSGASVRRQSGPLADFTARFLRGRLARVGEIDALALANDLVLHMACRFVCGDAISEALCDELARQFHILESELNLTGFFLPIETPSARRRKQARERIISIFTSEVRRVAAEGGADPEGYLHAVIKSSLGDEPTAATAEQLRNAALAVMGAVLGAHTNTAMSLAASLSELLEHPRALAAVLEEQSRVLQDGQALDLGALCRMPVLLRSINESLRLHGNGGLWRLSRRPVELGGHVIPAGSLIGMSMGLVNGDSSFYHDPARYEPERYCDMKTDAFQSPAVKDRRFGAFGLGHHVCPGRTLAYTMLGIALTVLLRDFRIEVLRRPRAWLDLMMGGMARPVGQLRIRLTPARCAPAGVIQRSSAVNGEVGLP
ncbi:cytochrome P450 [Sorangium atrum]|uniref:Cytochrome P450 n=1 Tax=Sorangium atrum TaxID=2995308 RepID=A0ABT5BPU1_9BACT|nr:cytochrome P450 [Sorangium aterium]MDC0676166.1 cytochrome P450 [Sorangium aterium]